MSSTEVAAFLFGVGVGAVVYVAVVWGWPWLSRWRAHRRPLSEFKARLAAYAATHLPGDHDPDLPTVRVTYDPVAASWNPTGTSSTAVYPEGDIMYTMAPVWADLADEFDDALWETLDDEADADADADEGDDEGADEFDALWPEDSGMDALWAEDPAEALPDADEFNALPDLDPDPDPDLPDSDRRPYERPTLWEFNPAPVEALTVLDGVTMAEAVPPDVSPDRRDMVASALREFNRR